MMRLEHTTLIDQSALISLINSSISWAQLERGKLDIAYRVVPAAPLVVSSRTLNLATQLQAKLAQNKTAVAILESRGPGSRWFGQEVDSECVAICRDELDLRLPGASTALAITVDEKELQSQFPDSPDASDIIEGFKRTGVSRNPLAAIHLRTAIRSVCSRQAAPQTVTGALIPLLATALKAVDGYSVGRSDFTKRRFAAVRTCEGYMRENLDKSLTILDLSRLCGMRARSLINAFEAVTGYSPMDYLKKLRLSEVHRSLLRADASRTRIINVATDWGFWHMGHFARDYRAMFGESPSRTLLK
jgi:AraC family transcriptional regulator, ethanolamine operon transcriptional activator